jgi:hypothetical protein
MSIDLDRTARRIARGQIRTAGRIEFIRDQGPVRRDIRVKGYEWSSDALRNLAKILWAVERSHSYGIAALRLFSRMPASEFSPDGLLGGRGYIQPVKEMRAKLGQSIELVSEFADTVHDEINASHWAGAGGEPEVQEIIQDVEAVKARPEEFVQEQFQQEVPGEEFNEVINPEAINPTVIGPGREEDEMMESLPQGWGGETEPPAWSGQQTQFSSIDPGLDKVKKKKEEEDNSNLPTDDSDPKLGRTPPEMMMRTTIEDSGNYASAVTKAADELVVKARKASDLTITDSDFGFIGSSSVPVETLPGPRVKHIGPGEADEEFGYYTEKQERPSDDPMWEGFSSLDRIYEDGVADGVTGYTDATQGDETVFKMGAETYSWLPGANNDKNLNYYALGITDEDVEWMKQNAAPELPGDDRKNTRPYRDPLWDS